MAATFVDSELRPVPPRYVVHLGGAEPGGAGGGAGSDTVVDRDTVRGWLDAAAAEAAGASESRREALGRQLEAARAQEQAATRRLDDIVAELDRDAERRARRRTLREPLKAALAARREDLVALQERTAQLHAAVEEWVAIDDKRKQTEAALVALWERAGAAGAEAAGLAPVIGDMIEAEVMLGRADRRRASAAVAAEAAYLAARAMIEQRNVELAAVIAEWWSTDGEQPLPLTGLLVLEEADATRAAADERGRAEAERRLASSRVAEVRLELEGLSEAGTGVEPAAAVVDHLREQARSDGQSLVVDDLVADMEDADATAILIGLGSLIEDGARILYRTADKRVLAWAIGLPAGRGVVRRA